MVVYDSAKIYVDCAKTLTERLARINAIIDALEETALRAAANEDITSYMIDNGQTKINTMYRDSAAVTRSILAFEQIKERILKKLNKSSVVRLVDGKNFIGGRSFR